MSPGKFKNFEKEIMLIEAIEGVKKWHKHRTWLKQNGVDVEEFEEEQEYQELLQEYKLLTRA